MREIAATKITEVVKKLCIEANCYLPQDMKDRIQQSYEMESWPQAKEILERIIENYKNEIAQENENGKASNYYEIEIIDKKSDKDESIRINMNFLGLDLSKVPGQNMNE